MQKQNCRDTSLYSRSRIKKVLLTGGYGFIGARLIRQLYDLGEVSGE